MKSNFIIFTDLDGTLLDHHTYSFKGAKEALGRIRKANIPLILCSSKTRAEMEIWRKRLKNRDPFISENGGAIFSPERIEMADIELAKKGNYWVIELGIPYRELMDRYQKLKGIFKDKIRGFSEMETREVVKLTGLPREEASRAKRREYTEPFIFDGREDEVEKLRKEIKDLDLNVTRGGRFFHLMGDNDKGKAVNITSEIYQKNHRNLKTIALGDSLNDLSMLKTVDIPFLVKKPGGKHDERVSFVKLRHTSGVGPFGWNEAIESILKEGSMAE